MFIYIWRCISSCDSQFLNAHIWYNEDSSALYYDRQRNLQQQSGEGPFGILRNVTVNSKQTKISDTGSIPDDAQILQDIYDHCKFDSSCDSSLFLAGVLKETTCSLNNVHHIL